MSWDEEYMGGHLGEKPRIVDYRYVDVWNPNGCEECNEDLDSCTCDKENEATDDVESGEADDN
jgi:hypothetical protein